MLAKALNRLPIDVFCQDILEFPIEEEIEKRSKPGKKAKVIANLPYNLTTPIIQRLIPMHQHFSHIAVMVQEEVARRFSALPGSKDYGSITVFLNFYSVPSYGFKVSRNCFYPSPKVDSAIVLFELKPPPAVHSIEGFFSMTRTAFGQRRKMLKSSLKKLYPTEMVEEGLKKIGKNPQIRPEQLSLNDFIQLYSLLNR